MTSPKDWRHRQAGWAFLIPIAAYWSAPYDDVVDPTGGQLVALAAIGTGAGALWQLLHRRDLADRLTHFASLFTVVVVFLVGAIGWDERFQGSWGGSLMIVAGIVTGLVYAEQWIRWREYRSSRVAVRRVPERVR